MENIQFTGSNQKDVAKFISGKPDYREEGISLVVGNNYLQKDCWAVKKDGCIFLYTNEAYIFKYGT